MNRKPTSHSAAFRRRDLAWIVPVRGFDDRCTRAALARASKRGQALVETALILPVLLLVVTGIMQFGILLSGQVAMVNGVREAARFGSVLQTASPGAATTDGATVHGRLVTVLAGGMPAYQAARLTGSSVCYVSYQNPGSTPPTYSVRITVSATYSHALFVPIIAQILDPLDGAADGGFTLHASERFRVENIPLGSNVIPTSTGSTTGSGTC